ncbi:MAG: hypothetical protein WC829_04385 [Hyphomicrobium sp.]|jgi:hypothetical protein
MMTRADYLNASREEQPAAHRRYYGEIVAALSGPKAIALPFSADEIRLALATGDEHLNTLLLGRWDAYVSQLRGANAELKKRGDYLTLGTGVCILKEAARQLAEIVD